MLTSPQSIINCSFQMCQRGKGLRGRLERAEGRDKKTPAVQLRRQGRSAWATPRACWGGGCPSRPAAQNHREQEARHLEWTLSGNDHCTGVTPSLTGRAWGQETFCKGPVFLGFAGHSPWGNSSAPLLQPKALIHNPETNGQGPIGLYLPTQQPASLPILPQAVTNFPSISIRRFSASESSAKVNRGMVLTCAI